MEDEEETESDSVGRVVDSEAVRTLEENMADVVKLRFTAVDHGKNAEEKTCVFVVDTGVNKTLITEEFWKTMQNGNGPRLKRNRVRFTPFGTNKNLECIGRSKALLKTAKGAEIKTMVYVIRGSAKECLLGRKDSKRLGIVVFNPEGSQEVVGRVEYAERKAEVISDEERKKIAQRMKVINDKFPKLFEGIGRATGVDPIHIHIDETVTPVQQKRRPVPLHYVEKLKKLLDQLVEEGVVSGPLDDTSAIGWIHNTVITDKKNGDIRLTLDTRPMAKAVKASHFPIPTPQELRHNFAGAEVFSKLDMTHAFYQFLMDEETRKHYTFYTPWGLYCFNTMVMGVSSASGETHERIKNILHGLEGVAQIKDDICVYGTKENHDERLEAVFKRLIEHGITLNKRKCELGLAEVSWFGYLFSKHGMAKDPEKVKIIQDWQSPKDKSEVKSFLQTVMFSQTFMCPGNGKTYADVTRPLRALTTKSTRFYWSKECEESFQELKRLLMSDRVLANFEQGRKTRVYVDDGPHGLGATLAQKYDITGIDHPVWRPVAYASRTKTTAELNYGKVDGESLALLFGIKVFKMYLYGIQFEVVVDHKPLLALYNGHSKDRPARVERHISKLGSFDFEVTYEPGVTNPSDYPSRHPFTKVMEEAITSKQKEELSLQTQEEETEIVIRRCEEMIEAVTYPILERYSEKDPTCISLRERIKTGSEPRKKDADSEFKHCFQELGIHGKNVIMRGNRLLIPKKLRPSILRAGHAGHPGTDSMLRMLRSSVWWPGITKDVKEFVETCRACSAAVKSNTRAPLEVRPTPDKVWQHCSADFKGPIGGEYYFHVLIDDLSRFPIVQVSKSTGFKELRKNLEEVFGMFGIPESITHDGGPPYNSEEWQRYAKEKGFQAKKSTPEHPESNGIVERFMSVLRKTVHTAIAEKRDVKEAVQMRVFNFRNTTHPSTGKTPAELMFGRQVKTLIPCMLKEDATTSNKSLEEAKMEDRRTRMDRVERYNKRKGVQKKNIQPGDQVLIQQTETSTKSKYNSEPLHVKAVKGTQVTMEKGSRVLKRHENKVKLLKKRPERLCFKNNTVQKWSEDDSDVDIDVTAIGNKAVGQEETQRLGVAVIPAREDSLSQSERSDSEDSQFTITVDSSTERNEAEMGDVSPTPNSQLLGTQTRRERENKRKRESPTLSPRERKRRQADARFRRLQARNEKKEVNI